MVGQLASPARVTFALRNAASVRRQFVLEADTYRLMTRECDEGYKRQFAGGGRSTRIAESRARWDWARRTQAYGDFPVPRGWSVRITPSEPVLEPGEELTVEVVIEPDTPGFSGEKVFNVHGFSVGPGGTRQLVGGVTIMVRT
ncbi:hypothetical protein ACFWP3_38105 [Streptomyces sp. NPDC058525]|uniref:hypothetical protein n=1 Tax=Streptomyces sp. NPDC058525 TaxID=3346538 RepID=UPI00365813A9